MQNDLNINIETPENITFGYALAGLGSRFLSTMIDTIIIVFLLFLANLLAVYLILLANLQDSPGWIIAILSALNFLLVWGYYIIFESVWNGQTPGKRLFSMRVVGRDGVPVSFFASSIRNLVRIIDFFPSLYGVGILTMFLNKKQLRLGDMAAGTLVVYDKNVTLADLDKIQSQSDSSSEVPTGAQANLAVEKLDKADIELAESYLQRQDQLGTDIQLIRPILLHLYDKMGQPIEEKLGYREATQRIQSIVNLHHSRQS